MNNKRTWILPALAAGSLGIALAYRRRTTRLEVQIWHKQRKAALDVMACPNCHGRLVVAALSQGQGYHCPACQKDYPIMGGIAHFIQPEELAGMNKTLSQMYDWFSWGYRFFSKVAFAYIGVTEEEGRREVTDRLEPNGGRVLEVSIGPGVNLPYLVGRPDVGEIYGLDLSLGQLRRCREYAAHRGWNVQLDLGNAELLPYQDDTFSGVFHIGGINFFDDKKKAIEEMIRVAKPGARILIGDETEKGARSYEKIIPGFKGSFEGEREAVQTPVDLVPVSMLETRVFDIWKGWFYCIEFRKPYGKEVR